MQAQSDNLRQTAKVSLMTLKLTPKSQNWVSRYVEKSIFEAADAIRFDFQGHSPVVGLFKCNSSNIYAAFYTDSTDSVLAVHLR